MSKQILLIHGRHYKPAKADLQKLWIEAIRHGIERDFPSKLQDFKDARIELVYYGDISNQFLSKFYDESVPDDLDDRKASLTKLKQYSKSQFTKKTYKNLPDQELTLPTDKASHPSVASLESRWQEFQQDQTS